MSRISPSRPGRLFILKNLVERAGIDKILRPSDQLLGIRRSQFELRVETDGAEAFRYQRNQQFCLALLQSDLPALLYALLYALLSTFLYALLHALLNTYLFTFRHAFFHADFHADSFYR